MIAGWFVSAALATPLTPDEVVSAALSHDPALALAQAQVQAAEGERKAATGLRHNPTLAARVGFGAAPHELTLAQPISFTGEGLVAARAARAGLDGALAARDHRPLEVAAAARQALIAAVATAAEQGRADEVAALATTLREAAERRLAAGEAPELEVHLARLEEAAAAADRMRAVQAALAARDALAARTGLPADDLPADPMIAVPPPGTAARRADHAAAEARVEAAEAAVRRERAAIVPPVALGAWAEGRAGEAWTVAPTATVTLPLWHANPAGIGRALGERDLARAELASIEARIESEAAGAAVRQRAIDLVGQASDPGPEARAALAGIEVGVGAGEIGPAEAALLRARVLSGWSLAASARAEAASATVDRALAESWSTLLPAP